MQIKYTDEQISFLKKGFHNMTVAELTVAFNAEYHLNKRCSAIRSTIKREKITRKRRILPGRRLTFSTEQQQFIRENYPEMSLKELSVVFVTRFGPIKTAGQIRTFIHNHGITSGRTGRFKKGMTSWNKGIKGYIGANITSFRKGNIPANWKPLGTERVNRDGYIEVKVAERNPYTGHPTRYRLKHQILWERARGPVPAGKIVIFLDGDKSNCSIENLACISRAEGVRLNQFGYTNLPIELKPTMMALVQLKARACGLMRSRR
jgi:hypothetical protein